MKSSDQLIEAAESFNQAYKAQLRDFYLAGGVVRADGTDRAVR